MPGMDPRMMKQAMKKMGIEQEAVPAQAVIVVLDGKRLVFDAPDLQKITMQGQESFQLSGEYREEPIEAEDTTVSDEDIDTVAEQTGSSREQARAALEAADGDIAAAIINLSE